MSRIVTLRRLFAKITEEGAFGDGRFVVYAFEDDSEKGTQFASTVFFVTAQVSQNGTLKEIPVVVKVQSDDEEIRSSVNLDALFLNEVTMYKAIIPMMTAWYYDIFPECFFCRAQGGENYKNDVIVLKDLRSEGFCAPNSKAFLDLPHLLLAVRKLGEFHGLSYRYKEENYGQENMLLNQLAPTKFTKEWLNPLKPILLQVIKQNKDLLASEGPDKVLFNQLIKMNDDDFLELFNFVTKPDEPFAVICHGDFKRNNLLFKYGGTGSPIAVKFFDLQNSVYSEPALDLSCFLYTNASCETRQTHWAALLDAYWRGVVTTAPRTGFSRAVFFSNFAEKAFVGFVEALLLLTSANARSDAVNGSSDTERQVLVRDALKHAVDNNYLKLFLERCMKTKTWYNRNVQAE